MKIKRTLTATLGAFALGAIVLGGAAPATAATNADASAAEASATQISGKLVLDAGEDNAGVQWYYSMSAPDAPSNNHSVSGERHTSYDAAAAAAGTFSIPAVGEKGPVRHVATDQCLFAWQGALDWQACKPSLTQDFVLKKVGGGYVLREGLKSAGNVYGTVDVGGKNSYFRYGFTNPNPVQVIAGLDSFVPEGQSATADPTASVISTNPMDKSGVIGGAGEPGATIVVTGPNGLVETVVDTDGKWSVKVPGLAFGDNNLAVKQVIEGQPDKETSITVALAPADLTAEVEALDNDAHVAHVAGTGQPGATITVDGPEGAVAATVDSDGTWSVNVPGLADGDNALLVTQMVDGAEEQSVELTVTLVAGPIANPLVAGALLAAAAVPVLIRRRKAFRA